MPGGSSPYRKANTAERAKLAGIVFDLRLAGHSCRAIDALSQAPDGPTGGYRVSATTAKELVREEVARRNDPRVDEWRAFELGRLDAALVRLNGLEDAARQVLEREHITVNNGRIIVLDGSPLPDDGPVLAAIDRLIKVEDARQRNSESRRKLLGLDAPAKYDAQVTEVTQQDLELQEMIRDAQAAVQLEEQQIIDGGTA